MPRHRPGSLVINESTDDIDYRADGDVRCTRNRRGPNSGHVCSDHRVGSQRAWLHQLENYRSGKRFQRESDVRLLQTLASSMGVALENARLFDETQRLLKETEQRAAELAIINSVQEALASKLDMQAIYDLIGEKTREVFHVQVVDIVIYDEKTNLMYMPFSMKMVTAASSNHVRHMDSVFR